MIASHQYVNQNSGKTEWYTPPPIVKAARYTMGGIDLDPASSQAANEHVRAAHIFTRPGSLIVGYIGGRPVLGDEDRGGLDQLWYGRVWMNHPFSSPERACQDGCSKAVCQRRGYHLANDRPGNEDWINALVDYYRRGHVEQACCIVFASLSERWFQPLLDFPMCFPNGRINYIDPDTDAPTSGATKGSVVVYLGGRVDAFAHEFRKIGKIYVPYAAFPPTRGIRL